MQKNISIICVPFSIGGPNNAAKDGPKALLNNYLDYDLRELGFNVKIIKPPKLKLRKSSAKNRIKNIESLVKVNEWLAETVTSEIKRGNMPLTIGGDHSLAIGTIAGVCNAINSQLSRPKGARLAQQSWAAALPPQRGEARPTKLGGSSQLGVLWIDRHFDAHSPKNTPSWRAHGMPVAVAISDKKYDPHPDFQRLLLIGQNKRLPKVKPQTFVQIGIGEKSCIKPNTKWYSIEDIDNKGIKRIINEAISYLLKRVKKIYVAWDIDSMSVTGTGTSGDGQLTLREGLIIARAINKKIRLAGRLAGFEIVEVAPSLERKDLKGQTVDWAIQLVTTCFGGNLFNNLSRLKRNIHV